MNSQNSAHQQMNDELTKLLTNYFSQRGSFLAQIIRADLQSLPHLTKQIHQAQQNGHGNANQHYIVELPTSQPASISYAAVQQPQAAPQVAPQVVSQPTIDVEAILVNLVVKQTGFPRESITLQLRLLDDLNLDSIKGGELVAGTAKECGVAGKVDPSTLANASLQEIVEAVRDVMPSVNQTQVTPVIPPQPVVIEPKQESKLASIPNMLLEMVVQRTGFPRETLSMNLHLLDDLNLDSIKTAEFVAEAAKRVGVEGLIDPSNFANATLAEIATVLQQLTEKQKPSVQPQPVQPSLKVSTTLPVSESIPWVRDFVVEYVPEEKPVLPASSQEDNWETTNMFEVDNWSNANILIMSEVEEADFVEILQQEFLSQGARVQAVTFEQVGDRSLIHSVEFTHFIAVLPRSPKGEMTPEARLQRAMQRVRAAATPPAAAKAQRQYTTVAYIQFGGGYFGRLAQVTDIEQSCSMGFAASLHLERSDLKVRVIDVPVSVTPTSLTERIIAELSRPEAFVAVGYDTELTRLIPRPRVQDTVLYEHRDITWLPKDVFLITGGAKGITAECALALARTTGVRMALVGSSAHPQVDPTGKSSAEIANTLQHFQDEGLTCRYYQCNVNDAIAVANLVQRVEKELGKITGVIHGSALNKPRRVENASLEEARTEVAPKLLGVMNLIQALANKPPKMFVGFSSISAVLGLPGNTWYGFSNEALDLILRRFGEEHPETATLAIAFSVWAEVGMGARMGTVRNLNRMGIEAMPTDEAVRRFLHLMQNDPGDPQVVVSARLGGIDTLRRGFDTWRTKRMPPAAALRFIEQVQIMEPDVEIVARTHLSLERDSYVKDHIYKGSYLFPTVFGLEAMAQAVAYATGLTQLDALRIEDIRLERPIVVDPENGIDIEIRAEVLERESVNDFRKVRAEIRTERTGFAMAHFAATFVFDQQHEAPKEQIKLPPAPLDIDPQQDLYGWLLFQGPRFQRIQQVYSLNSKKFVFRTQKGVPAVTGEEKFDRASGPFLLGDPYYRDSLLQAVQPVVPQDICLPIRINSIQVYQTDSNISGSCIGVVNLHGRQGRQYNSTVFAVDEAGRIIEKLDGYHLQILEHRENHPTAEDLADPTQRDEQLLRRELNNRAKALQMTVPEASLAQLPGLHALSAAERRQREIPVFSKTVGKLLSTLE
ncbi:SDR family NAD(P)-dependent oxidoreductase [Nostocales cyanobacterium LEGE 11386]|nr:SDR family NAD(P)-dependent oxidoreductase [Nostocales cyanobacterium LEGE 11386]